jgi:hypothetical protein
MKTGTVGGGLVSSVLNIRVASDAGNVLIRKGIISLLVSND